MTGLAWLPVRAKPPGDSCLFHRPARCGPRGRVPLKLRLPPPHTNPGGSLARLERTICSCVAPLEGRRDDRRRGRARARNKKHRPRR
jgi:hypothetical protein